MLRYAILGSAFVVTESAARRQRCRLPLLVRSSVRRHVVSQDTFLSRPLSVTDYFARLHFQNIPSATVKTTTTYELATGTMTMPHCDEDVGRAVNTRRGIFFADNWPFFSRRRLMCTCSTKSPPPMGIILQGHCCRIPLAVPPKMNVIGLKK